MNFNIIKDKFGEMICDINIYVRHFFYEVKLRRYSKESLEIARHLYFLHYGKFSERKKYYKELHESGKISIGGYVFELDGCMAIIVWKQTDMAKQPQYKGEPLSKIVPSSYCYTDEYAAVLDAQHWVYN